MKRLFNTLFVVCMTVIMFCTFIPATSAQEVPESTTVTVVSVEDDGSKAYDLVWKYKKENGHYYKRRWNNTMNVWYDPAWILVY